MNLFLTIFFYRTDQSRSIKIKSGLFITFNKKKTYWFDRINHTDYTMFILLTITTFMLKIFRSSLRDGTEEKSIKEGGFKTAITNDSFEL